MRRHPTGTSGDPRRAGEQPARLDVTFPLGLFICVTGVSGSGKSSLIHEILYKKLYAPCMTTVPAGKHRAVEGVEYVTDIIDI
jgi:excinuclease ABC subunit A